MPEVLTETDEKDLLLLYNAACRAKQLFVQGRSFDEWRDRVSDAGLAAARYALEAEIDAERERLEREVIEAAKKYRLAVREHMEYAKECMGRDRSHDEEEDPKWDAQLGAQCTAQHTLSIAVDALIDFESSQQQIKK